MKIDFIEVRVQVKLLICICDYMYFKNKLFEI